MATPWLAAFDPFTLTGPRDFAHQPPPALTSERYTKDYNEVKALGSFNSTKRPPEQTDITSFYGENPRGSGTRL